MKKLENKVAVITGGNSGIGFATAQKFIAEGAKVIITGRSQSNIDEAVSKLGHGVIGLLNDAGNINQVVNLSNQLKEHGIGKVDVLFYNAGVGIYAPVEQMSEEQFDANMNINFKAAFFTVQQLIPMFNDGGTIIFNASVLAGVSMQGNGAYGASKVALVNLAKTLALELSDRKIRTNTISPGNINTPIYSKLGLTEEQLNGFANDFISKIPLGRFGNPEEIANLALFLANDESGFINGTEIISDGGYSAQ